MADPSGERDPGWFSAKSFLWTFVPGLGVRRAQQEVDNALQMLRLLFTSFAMALFFIGVVVVVLSSGTSAAEATSVGPIATSVVGCGMFSLFIPRFVERPLDCSSPQALVVSYRTRFFLRIAFADAAALVGFVGFFLADAWWLYPLGVAFALVGFARLAPTRANLARDQEELNLAGCGHSLVHVLTAPAD